MGKKTYKVTLTTLGPVHIGNGGKISNKDYFIDGNKIAVINPVKFAALLNKEQLEAYCELLKTNSRTGLHDILINDQELMRAAKNSIAYAIDAKLSRNRGSQYQYLDAAEFVKDAYGCPYVPGSSFKGVLRTALLSEIIRSNQDTYKQYYYENAVLDRKEQKKADKELDKAALWTERIVDDRGEETINDILKYLSISDSDPLSTGDLVFVKKYDKFSRNDDGSHKHDMGNLESEEYRQGNELNIYRECIKPGVKIDFALVIDERLGISIEYITKAITNFCNDYKKYFVDNYDIAMGDESAAADDKCNYIAKSGPLEGHRCPNPTFAGSPYCRLHQDKASDVQGAGGGIICYIGGGVDFDSKTVINALYGGDGQRLSKISQILYSQFPTKVDRNIFGGLWDRVEESGFEPQGFRAQYRNGNQLKKGKEDHRHWQDEELGVSPHTLKLGKIGNEYYEMGKCSVKIEEL